MENLKIRVNSEAENKEAQELFFELGGKPHEKTTDRFGLVIFGNGVVYVDNINFESYYTDAYSAKEITLPQLRDLVVLKRNSIDDATHKDSITDNVYYVSSDEEVYRFESSAWCFSTVPIAYLKPIEKPMKEYLRKNNDGEYILEVTNEREAQEPHAKHWIEVPSGMNIYWKEDGDYWFTTQVMGYRGAKIIWQRHTHPEELPFIDDEPSLNDQYAEIEKLRQTLNQRQEQYGSFEDVAMFTEQMVDVMRRGYYEKLAYNQKMALYMICSKMARIVNGNPNHKDSWHDIAGYATLIDNELVSEKDMPF